MTKLKSLSIPSIIEIENFFYSIYRSKPNVIKLINVLSNRNISLFQRSTYTNSCILNKVWYISHSYPLPGLYVKEIKCIIFIYLWCRRYEPIRRSTVFKLKNKCSLGLINCPLKSKILLVNSFFLSFIGTKTPLMLHYCSLKMKNVIPKDFSFFMLLYKAPHTTK